MSDELLPPEAVAQMLGVSVGKLSALRRRGKITGEPGGLGWFYYAPEDVSACIERMAERTAARIATSVAALEPRTKAAVESFDCPFTRELLVKYLAGHPITELLPLAAAIGLRQGEYAWDVLARTVHEFEAAWAAVGTT